MAQQKTANEMKSNRAIRILLILAFGGVVYLALVHFLSRQSAGPPRSAARRPNCLSHLRQIGLALAMYADAHHRHLPPEKNAKGLDYLLRENLKTPRVFVCTADAKRRTANAGEALTEDTCSYVYIPTAWQSRTDTNLLPVCWDKPGNHGTNGLNVLFNNGHVDWLTREQWEAIRPDR